MQELEEVGKANFLGTQEQFDGDFSNDNDTKSSSWLCLGA